MLLVQWRRETRSIDGQTQKVMHMMSQDKRQFLLAVFWIFQGRKKGLKVKAIVGSEWGADKSVTREVTSRTKFQWKIKMMTREERARGWRLWFLILFYYDLCENWRKKSGPINMRSYYHQPREGRQAVLFSRLDGGTVWVNLFKVTSISDAAPNGPRGTCCAVIRSAPFTRALSHLLTLWVF